MREFITAALPWILMGLALAVFFANQARPKDEEEQEQQEQKMTAGILLGLLLGIALNEFGWWESPALGLAIGPLWGMALTARCKN